jgi:hypothetical protein
MAIRRNPKQGQMLITIAVWSDGSPLHLTSLPEGL